MTSPWHVGFLGPEGSHSHQAGLHLQAFLTTSPLAFVPFATFRALLEATQQTPDLLGLVPIENALEGSVVEVLEALGLQKYSLQPLAEFTVPVLHCLIQTVPGPVETVVSHPQALGQCRDTLLRLFGEQLHFEAASSTSEAVRHLAEAPDPKRAAIGTRAAAERYGLQVTHSDISDAPDNVTRFLLLAHSDTKARLQAVLSLPHEMPSKTSFCLRIPDQPGTLVSLLSLFHAYHVNLSKIESRPSKKKLGEYLFYIDAQGDLTHPDYEALLSALRQQVTFLQILGSYRCLGKL